MKKVWKNEEAVSPVIATILMVAITVVLAAVLYVLVGGLIDEPPKPPISGTINDVDLRSNTSVSIEFGTMSRTVEPTEIKVVLENQDGERISIWLADAPTSEDNPMTTNTPGITASYRDNLYQGNEVNSGDSIQVAGLDPSNRYSISIFDSRGTKAELGGPTTFTMPS